MKQKHLTTKEIVHKNVLKILESYVMANDSTIWFVTLTSWTPCHHTLQRQGIHE